MSMNDKLDRPEDARLKQLLQEWKTDAEPPASFKRGVWRKIAEADEAERARLPSFWEVMRLLCDRLFGRLAPALACFGLLFLVAGWLGVQTASGKSSKINESMAAGYVVSVDPYLKAFAEKP